MRSHRLLWIFLLQTVLAAGLAAASSHYWYSYVPKQVFMTQVFPVTVFADADSAGDAPTFSFDPQSTVQPLDKHPLKSMNGGNTFYTFYFRAEHDDGLVIPKLTIADQNRSTVLEPRVVPTRRLDVSRHKEFCGLIATKCKILTSQISEFDAENTLVSLTIKASEANPGQIKTPGSIESGVEKVVRRGSDARIEYYFVVPSSLREITSSYYNSLENRFITKTISTDYRAKTVAAQESLNPVDSGFSRLKRYGLILLSIFFFWMFWKRKDFFYLILFTACGIALLVLYQPKGSICVQEGAPLYILPTNTSMVSGQIEERLTTEILGQRSIYSKIAYKNHTIGWIKDEDRCED